MGTMILMYISEDEAEKLSEEYYKNEQKKIRKLVDNILFKLKYKDIDPADFYSLANEIFIDVLIRYDGKQNFEGFLYSCLLNKFKTEMTRRNRKKRQADKMAISIDTPIGDNENSTIGDVIADKSTIEKELFEKGEEGYSKKMLLYLSRLSVIQKEMLRLTIAGYLPGEIKEELHITEKQYCDNYAAIHSYRNVSVLF